MSSGAILAIDVGCPDFVGILDHKTRRYDAYWKDGLDHAVERIEAADEIITFNGWKFDLPTLARYVGREELSLSGRHTDMLCVCWRGGYFGKGLSCIYKDHFGEAFVKPLEPYSANNRADCEMALSLWESWRRGSFKCLDTVS